MDNNFLRKCAAFSLAVATFCAVLSGCGNDKDNDSSTADSSPTTYEAPATDNDSSSNSLSDDAITYEVGTALSDEISKEDRSAYPDNCRFKINTIERDPYGGYKAYGIVHLYDIYGTLIDDNPYRTFTVYRYYDDDITCIIHR